MQIYYADITNYHTHIKLATHTTKPHSTKGVARVWWNQLRKHTKIHR
jgi:hypothetical protein